MIRRIDLKTEKRNEIANALGVTLPYVSMALRFKRNGPVSNTIREMALQNGGIYMEEKEMERPVKVLDAKGNIVKTL